MIERQILAHSPALLPQILEPQRNLLPAGARVFETCSVVVPIRDCGLQSLEYIRAIAADPKADARKRGEVLRGAIRMEANFPAGIICAVECTGNSCCVTFAVFTRGKQGEGGVRCILPGIFPHATG